MLPSPHPPAPVALAGLVVIAFLTGAALWFAIVRLLPPSLAH